MPRLALLALTVPLAFGALLACKDDAPPEPSTTAIVDAGEISPVPPVGDGKSAPHDVLNKEFRTAYAKARDEQLEKIPYTIIASGDELILRKGNETERVRVLLPHYHVPKTAAHMPLTAWLFLGPMQPSNAAELFEQFKAQLEIAEEIYDELDASDEDMKKLKERFENESGGSSDDPMTKEAKAKCLPTWSRDHTDVSVKGVVKDLIDDTKKFIADNPKNAGDPNPPSGLQDFIDCQKDNIEKAITYAAYAQLIETHAVVEEWTRDHNIDLENLHVVVIGPKLPRERNTLVQYFSRYLEGDSSTEVVEGEDPRLVYAETLFYDKAEIEATALGLLGTNRLDYEIGNAFFGDRKMMTHDILADAAEEWIKNKFASQPTSPSP